MKKLLLISFIFILVFFIYYINLDDKIYVLSIGDYNIFGNEEYNYHNEIDNYLGNKIENNVVFANNGDYRIVDLLRDIDDNKKFSYKNKEYTINNSLIKADILFISIGTNDLMFNKNMSYDYVDEVIIDLDKLLNMIRKYCKEKIYIFNYYNLGNEELTAYVNNKLKKLVVKFHINIVDRSIINNFNFKELIKK